MTQKDRAADLRLQRIYGITLAEYEMMLKRYNGGCWICGKLPKPGRRLHTDHDHAVHKVKVIVGKAENGWYASIPSLSILVYNNVGRKEARIQAKRLARRRSVRGLLCWSDNAGLQKFRDNPDRLEAAAKYLREYKEKGNQLG